VIVLYDRDCGFCRWTLGLLLAWDRRRRLRPAAIQSADGERLLTGMSTERRMESWHLAWPDGRVASAGDGVGPLLRALPGGAPAAWAAERFPGATRGVYSAVARRRGTFGRLLRPGQVRRADRRIAGREAAQV
jgi:predicted DCC family thiol-disulfide oxidoreductase YuxK